MNRQINRGKVQPFNRHEMLDLWLVDGKARGIIARNLLLEKSNVTVRMPLCSLLEVMETYFSFLQMRWVVM